MKLSPEEAAAILAYFIEETDSLLLIRLNQKGRILDCSSSFQRLIAPASRLLNTPFRDCVARESMPNLTSLVEKGEPALLHLYDHEGFLCSCRFRPYAHEQSLLLAGARLASTGSRSLELMTRERNRTHKVLLDRISTETVAYERLRKLTLELEDRRDLLAADEDLAALLREISALLDSLGLADSAPSLTPQERKVLALLLEERSNREIAERLYVSIPTVKSHIASIYRKTGVRSRRELRQIQRKG